MKTILSLGMGVQSSTIALMSLVGELPALDMVCFADPGWESQATYDYARWLILYCEERGMRITVTRKPNSDGIRTDALTKKRFATMPFYTRNEPHQETVTLYIDKNTGDQLIEDELEVDSDDKFIIPDGVEVKTTTYTVPGGAGMVMRQCTSEYKIIPVQRAIRRFLGVEHGQRVKEKVEMWLGISMDEVERMKESKVPWIKHAWPLIDIKRFDRGRCVEWLKSRGFPIPPKSSCLGCPFHGDSTLLNMKRNSPKEFADVVDFDAKIRTARKNMRSELFLHKTLTPISEVYLGEDQGDMFANGCEEGHCGV